MVMASASSTHKEQVGPQPQAEAPRASIIVSTFNGERHLKEALESLLSQSFSDFELIVVDDGSSDRTAVILESFRDRRLIVLRHDNNLGIAASQNDALNIAKGEYIVLQDHDDASQPGRLESQISFLDSHPHIALVGSSCLVIDDKGVVKGTWSVSRHEISLKWSLLFQNPFLHTSAVIRRSALKTVGGYSADPNVRFVEDYDLISRIAAVFGVANIPEPLVSWREHPTQASSRNRAVQMKNTEHVASRNVERLLDGNKLKPEALKHLKTLLFNSPERPVNLSRVNVKEAIKAAALLDKKFRLKHALQDVYIRRHSRRVRWSWGKHLVALSYRHNGNRNVGCRVELLLNGLRFLLSAASPQRYA